MVDRHHRPEDDLARIIRSTRRGLRDVQRPTGTEKNRLVEKVSVTTDRVDTIESELGEEIAQGSRKPAATTGLTIAANTARWTGDGVAVADVRLEWDPVTEGEDSEPITVSGYEVWSRRPAEPSPTQDTTTTAPSGTVSSWEPGKLRHVAVRALNERGVPGAFSDEISVTPAVPASIVPKAPGALSIISRTAVWLTDGRAVERVLVECPVVSESLEDEPISISEYTPEVAHGDGAFAVSSVSAPRRVLVEIPARGTARVVFTAVSDLGVRSDPSPVLELTGGLPAADVRPPAAPSVVAGMGVAAVGTDWSLAAGGVLPAYADRVLAEYSLVSASGPWTAYAVGASKAGAVGSIPASVGSDVHVRLFWVDKLGRESERSAVTSVTVAGVALTDLGLDLTGALSDIRYTADGANRIYLGATEPSPDERNLFTNPRFAAVGAPVEIRRNLAVNPQFVNGATGWTTQTGTTIATGTLNGRPAGLITRGNGQNAILTNAGIGGAGDFTSARMVVSAAEESAVGITVSAFFYDGASTTFASVVLPAVGLEAELLVVSGRAMTAAHRLYIRTGTSADAGKTFYVTDVQYETTPALGMEAGAFFSGSAMSTQIVHAEDFTAAWVGGANASESILTGLPVTGFTTNHCILIRSTRCARPGTFSARWIVTGADPWAASSPDGSIPPEARAHGTILATAHFEKDGIRPRILAQNPVQSKTLPAGSPPGSHSLRLEFSDLTSTYRFQLRADNSTVTLGDEIWWTDVALVAGDFTGELRDTFTQRDLWYVLDETLTSVTQIRIWDGEAWNPYVFAADSIIATGSITGTLVRAGTLEVNHVSPAFGSQLGIEGNVTITATQQALADQQALVVQAAADAAAAQAAAGVADSKGGSALVAAAAAQAAAAAAQATADQYSQVFQFTDLGFQISRPGSPMTTLLTNADWSIRENGVARVWVNSEGLIAPTAHVSQMQIDGYLLEGGPGGLLITAL